MPKIWGYARVSTRGQTLDSQRDRLSAYGCDEILYEKVSGTKKKRTELNRLLEEMEPGDTVVVTKLDRISRSTKHLLELSEAFCDKDVAFVSMDDNIDTSTATGKFFFTVLAAQAQLERDLISERTREGLEAAKKRGKRGGRPPVDMERVKEADRMVRGGRTVMDACSIAGISKTVYYEKRRDLVCHES